MTTPQTPPARPSRRAHLPAVLHSLLENPRIRRIDHEGETWYVAEDVIALLSDTQLPAEYWEDLQRREPDLARLTERLELTDGSGDVLELLSLEGVLRVAQSLNSPAAQKLKLWLAASARKQLEDAADPTLSWVDTQKEYAHRGYSNSWVQKRLRGMAARQELVREWSRRGIKDSEHYRQLTNALFEQAFGMNVTAYRNVKFLTRASDNLRDHMNDLELTLTLLGETTAMTLHRARGSEGVEELLADVKDAGEITRSARLEIERRGSSRRMSA
jgi:DNA-damage-inducible protein D